MRSSARATARRGNRTRFSLLRAGALPIAIVAWSLIASPAAGETVTLTPSADNTLYDDPDAVLSNGRGDHLFAGNTALSLARRALLRFDVAQHVTSGATITSASLRLHVSREIAGSVSVALHRVLADWGEGSSDAPGEEGMGAEAAAGDATWEHTFFDTDFWQEPGGDFEAVASAERTVDAIGFYTWESTPALVADVQAWLDAPAEDFGWIVIADESRAVTAKRFDSRENPASENRPRLVINFENGAATETPVPPSVTSTATETPVPPSATPTATETPVLPSATPVATETPAATVTPTRAPACPGDCNDDGEVAINELVTGVAIALGTQPATICPAVDGNDDGRVTINELVSAVAAALNGCPASTASPPKQQDL